MLSPTWLWSRCTLFSPIPSPSFLIHISKKVLLANISLVFIFLHFPTCSFGQNPQKKSPSSRSRYSWGRRTSRGCFVNSSAGWFYNRHLRCNSQCFQALALSGSPGGKEWYLQSFQLNLKCSMKFIGAPWFVTEISVSWNQPLVRMPYNGKYKRIPCQDLFFVPIVEREHLLHSLPVAVEFAKSSIVPPPVHPRYLVVRIDVRRWPCLRDLAPEYVTVWVVDKPARIAWIIFHFYKWDKDLEKSYLRFSLSIKLLLSGWREQTFCSLRTLFSCLCLQLPRPSLMLNLKSGSPVSTLRPPGSPGSPVLTLCPLGSPVSTSASFSDKIGFP